MEALVESYRSPKMKKKHSDSTKEPLKKRRHNDDNVENDEDGDVIFMGETSDSENSTNSSRVKRIKPSDCEINPSVDSDLLQSVTSSLPKAMRDQLAGSSDLIAMVAAKMAEQMASRKIQEELEKRDDEHQQPAIQTPKKPTSKSTTASTTSTPKPTSKLSSSKSRKAAHTLTDMFKPKHAAETSKTNDSNSHASNADEPPSETSSTSTKTSKSKLTDEEKKKREEENQLKLKKKEEERLERERKKAEERLRREEEKLAKERKKEQEKLEREQKKELEKQERDRKKQQEKLERERKRDEEKHRKEFEKQKKEEDKRKEQIAKDRQQLRLGAFFGVQEKPSSTGTIEKSNCADSTSQNNNTNQSPLNKKEESDYDKRFLSYYKRANVEIHLPLEGYERESSEIVTMRMDKDFKGGPDLMSWLKSKRTERGFEIKFTANEVVNIANSETTTQEDIENALASLPLKHLQFYENVRRPYQGTFSKVRQGGIPPGNPYFTTGTGLNYSYDSDLEWTPEDEDGEDLDNDDVVSEDDDEADEEDELSDFLSSDDSENSQPHRRRIVGPLNTFTTWNDGTNDLELFSSLEVDVLSYNNCTEGIDPFKDYWTIPTEQQKSNNQQQAAGAPKASADKKLVNAPDIKEFFGKIEGFKGNQILLIELLKQDFPQYSKETIKNTIRAIAKRVGAKEPKTWEINAEAKETYK